MTLLVAVVPAPAAPITVTVPYSGTPVADADLDGNPATGAWSDASSWTIPLENGAASPYGSATLYAKHDGTYVYIRVDGKIDVLWVSSTGNHFWFGIVFTSSAVVHHSSWQDGVFFGDDKQTSAQPLVAVDTNGGGTPPTKDASQDDLGRMAATGSATPYSFTAEWKRKLNTGDPNDIVFTADGTTSIYFYATTDSNGGGSRGGSISHRQTTNDNVMRFSAAPSGDTTPPTVAITAPPNGATVSGLVSIDVTATDNIGGSGVASVTFYVDGVNKAVDTTAPYQYSWDTTTAANGAHAIKADATDNAANTGTTSISVTVANVDTTPPVAVAGPDQRVATGTTVTLDGSGSTDNVGIVWYNWTFTDGVPRLLHGVTATYTFNNAGDFLVTLTATDAAGNSGSDTLWVNVTVDMLPPVAAAGPDQRVLQGSLVTLDGRASTDDVGVANYTWSFTDGGAVVFYGSVVRYRFLYLGNFLVTLTARDFTGKTGTDTAWVNVTADTIMPVAEAGPDQTVHLGDRVTLNGTNSTDNVYVANYTWRFGGTGYSLYGPIVSFTPTAGGVLVVTLTVADASALTAADSLNVTVIAPDRTPPSSVVSLEAHASGAGAIRLTWSPVSASDLAGYLLYRYSPEGLPILLNLEPLANTMFLDTGLQPGQVYEYVVVAEDVSGNVSPPSMKAQAAAGLAPQEPFDWLGVRWVLIPLVTGLVLLGLGLLALREQRRRRAARPPPPEATAPPPPPEVRP